MSKKKKVCPRWPTKKYYPTAEEAEENAAHLYTRLKLKVTATPCGKHHHLFLTA